MAEAKKEAKKADEKKKNERKPSALKRDQQADKKNLLNRAFKAKVRTAILSLEGSIAQKETDAAKKKLNDLFSLMDKGVKKGVFKKNKASRTKSRFHASAQVKA